LLVVVKMINSVDVAVGGHRRDAHVGALAFLEWWWFVDSCCCCLSCLLSILFFFLISAHPSFPWGTFFLAGKNNIAIHI
jgi:hypothetical protein